MFVVLPSSPGHITAKSECLFGKWKTTTTKKCVLHSNTLALLMLQTLRSSEFTAAILQLAENTAQKHSIPMLIRTKLIFVFFKIVTFCLKSEFTAWELCSINNMFSLSFIRQELYETSQDTKTLLVPNRDWSNRCSLFLTHGHPHIWGETSICWKWYLCRLSNHISLATQEIMMQHWCACNHFLKPGLQDQGRDHSSQWQVEEHPDLLLIYLSYLVTQPSCLQVVKSFEFGCESSKKDIISGTNYD